MTAKTIILIGFMGAGKSTVGRIVASELDVTFFDTDDWVEHEHSINISELVQTNVADFRRREAQALQELLDMEPGVIATGGGIVDTEAGRKVLLEADATIIWMQVPFNNLVQRINLDQEQDRPLINDIDEAKKLYRERIGLYKQTTSTEVDASKSTSAVVSEIVTIVAGEASQSRLDTLA